MHRSRPHNCQLLLQAAGWMQMLFHVRLGRQIGPFRWLLARRTDAGSQHASQPECAGSDGPSEQCPHGLQMQMKNPNEVIDKCSILDRRWVFLSHLVKYFTRFHTLNSHRTLQNFCHTKPSTFLSNLRISVDPIIIPSTEKKCVWNDAYLRQPFRWRLCNFSEKEAWNLLLFCVLMYFISLSSDLGLMSMSFHTLSIFPKTFL